MSKLVNLFEKTVKAPVNGNSWLNADIDVRVTEDAEGFDLSVQSDRGMMSEDHSVYVEGATREEMRTLLKRLIKTLKKARKALKNG